MMSEVRHEDTPSTSKDDGTESEVKRDRNELQYFQCSLCELREKYEYFGNDPPFYKNFRLSEDAYVIEDPFAAPKQGEILVLGSHCVQCNRMVCKDNNCSVYYDGTFCIDCAKIREATFPKAVREKINKIIR